VHVSDRAGLSVPHCWNWRLSKIWIHKREHREMGWNPSGNRSWISHSGIFGTRCSKVEQTLVRILKDCF